MSLLASSRAWTTAAVVATAAGVSYWYLKHSTLSSSGKQRVTGAVVEDGKATIQAPLVRPEDVKGEIRVAKLLIHPIKSCRGTSVQEAKYTPIGLEGDRRWCIIDPEKHTILTARQLPKMVLISPELLPDPDAPHGGVLRVSFPSESSLDPFEVPLYPSEDLLATWERAGDVAIWSWSDIDAYLLPLSSSVNDTLSKYLGRPAQLALKGPRERVCEATVAAPTLGSPDWPAEVVFQDGYPLLVASLESARAVQDYVRSTVGKQGVAEKWKEEELAIERFRPNFVLEGAGVPWAEDAFDEVIIAPSGIHPDHSDFPPIALVSKCTRCLLPNVDPTTGVRDPAVPFKPLMQTRRGLSPEIPGGACFGCNAVPRGTGVVRVGDVVHVRKWATS